MNDQSHPDIPPAQGSAPPPPPQPDTPAAAQTPPSATTAAPVAPSERNVTLDVLRGFAMLGILLVNMELFRGAMWPVVLGEAQWDGALDRAIEFATTWFAQSKFITSFAFMFGLGTAVQMLRAANRGDKPTGKLPRRFTILFIIGLLHGLLVWTGDILMMYAICGFGLLLFVNMSVRKLLWWAGGMAGVLTLLGTAFGLMGYWAMTAFGDEAMGDPDAGMEFLEPALRTLMDAYQTGSYADQVMVRLIELPITQVASVMFAPLLFILMLLGMAAAKSGMVADTGRFTRLLRRARLIGLGLGIPLNLLLAWTGGHTALMGTADPDQVAMANLTMPVMFIAPPILAMGYLATITLACQNPSVQEKFSPLAAVGRMAISAYLFQSIVASWFFIATGLYGEASPTVGLALLIAIWAVLLVVCPLWLKAFRMGPVEWLWRSATYGKAQPFRNKPAA